MEESTQEQAVSEEPKTEGNTEGQEAPKKTKGQLKREELQQKRFQAMMKEHRDKYFRDAKRLSTQVQTLKKDLGKEDFDALKSICTVNVPEEKDENGEILQKATSYVNKRALLVEGRHLIALKREDRIKNGNRKRSTGRSSDRSSHSSLVKFLTNRNQEASLEPIAEGT